MSKFLKSARRYALMVDFKSRLEREIPFVAGELEDCGITSGSVLDVGCGPGFHALELSRRGYSLSALDKDAAMAGEAKRRKAGIEVFEGDFLDRKILGSKKFDALYSLGNTVGLMASGASYEEVLKRFSEVLLPGGLLVFQTLNFEKKRNSWSKPRGAFSEEGEYVFLRNFSTTKKFVRPLIITLFRRKGLKEWSMETQGPVDIPRISSGDMSKLIEKSGFKDVNLYGSYSRQPFKSGRSVDMIWKALRK
ncbi:MAG: class I SAM-dependent methyltransferase [Elusimicrobiota bacterium]